MAIEGFLQFYGNMVKEDVKDVLFQITPTETPFQQMIGDTVARAPIHQWKRRSLTVRQPNAVQEGAAFSNQAGHSFNTNFNQTQILRKQPSVSRTTQASDMYAIRDSFLDELETQMLEIKTDEETALLKGSLDTGYSMPSAATRQMNGLVQGLSLSNYWSRSTDFTLTEAELNRIAKIIWRNGVVASDILCGMDFKQRLAGFAGWPDTGFGQQVHRINDDFKLEAKVDVYRTDAIEASVRLSRDFDDTENASNSKFLVIFDRDMFKKAWLTRPFTARRPYTADSEDGVILMELTLEFGHPNAGGWFCGQ